MDKVRAFYFLEDIAHESFIKALVEKVCQGIMIEHIVRNASGGKGRALGELKSFLEESKDSMVDGLLIVAIDSNCHKYTEQREKVAEMVKEILAIQYALAIPNPHIERWYMLDASALNGALGFKETLPIKQAKCKKDYYKNLFDKVLRESGQIAPLGAPDFAEDIVQEMDLYTAGKNDSSFKHFIQDIENYFKRR